MFSCNYLNPNQGPYGHAITDYIGTENVSATNELINHQPRYVTKAGSGKKMRQDSLAFFVFHFFCVVLF